MAGVTASSLWSSYSQENEAQSAALVGRGQAILLALEGGIRSHCRLGVQFLENLDSILRETASAPGVVGMAVFDSKGGRIVAGGRVPEALRPSSEPQWGAEGLAVWRRTLLTLCAGPDMRAGGMGRGYGGAEARDDERFKEPVWLLALLDDAPYRQTLRRNRAQFAATLTVTVASVLLGLAFVGLLQRQGRLAAELSLGREREGRLEEMARLGAGLAHETKNPLGLIRGVAQSWQSRSSDAEQRRQAQLMVDEADRVVGRINSFLNYARPLQPSLRAVDLGRALREIADLFRDEAGAKGIRLTCESRAGHGGRSRKALADPDMLRQVAVNLLANALAACSSGASVVLEVEADGKARLAFAVRDTGAGIAPQDLPQVAKPYFSRRPGGIGLGLAIVSQIVQSHGWRLDIESPPGRGTTVRVANIAEAPTDERQG